MGRNLPALARDEQAARSGEQRLASIQNFSFIVGPAIGGHSFLALGSVLIRVRS